MISESTIVAVNVPNSRDNFLTLFPIKKSNLRKGTLQKTCQRIAKNPTPAPVYVLTIIVINKQIAK